MQGRTIIKDKSYDKAEQKKHPSSASYLDFILQSKKTKDNNFKLDSRNEKILRLSEIIKMTIGSGVPLLITGEKGVGKTYLAEKVSKEEASIVGGKELFVSCEELSRTSKSIKDLFADDVIDLQEYHSLVFTEVANLNLANQEQLLKILKACCDKKQPRIIVTSSKNLTEQVQKGLFKQDLYYRLYVLHVQLPSLRERQEDLRHLVHEFLKETSLFSEAERISQEVADLFSRGKISLEKNIEGLKEYLFHRYVNRNKAYIEPSKPQQKIQIEKQVVETTAPKNFGSWLKSIPEGMTLKELETHYILEVLKDHDHNRTHTAKALGISLRTLRNKINQYRTEGYEVY